MNDRERVGEQVAVMDEIVRVADEEAADAVIVAGDLFDTFNPPVEAIELLYRTLHRLARGGQRLVVAIAGNHDSPRKTRAVLTRARAYFRIAEEYARDLPGVKESIDEGLRNVEALIK